MSSYEILETCIDEPRLNRGGAQAIGTNVRTSTEGLKTIAQCLMSDVIGEHNSLAIEVFAADSEHGEEIEVALGHEIPSFIGAPRGPMQQDYIDDSDEDEDMQVCFAGESAGWCLNASKCCSGYKFVLRKLENVYQLLGIDVVSAISSTIGTCSKI